LSLIPDDTLASHPKINEKFFRGVPYGRSRCYFGDWQLSKCCEHWSQQGWRGPPRTNDSEHALPPPTTTEKTALSQPARGDWERRTRIPAVGFFYCPHIHVRCDAAIGWREYLARRHHSTVLQRQVSIEANFSKDDIQAIPAVSSRSAGDGLTPGDRLLRQRRLTAPGCTPCWRPHIAMCADVTIPVFRAALPRLFQFLYAASNVFFASMTA
jgi:hypothetical protein